MDTFRDAPDYFWGVLQCCKKKPKLPKTISAEPTGPDPVQTIDLILPGSGPPGRLKPVRLSWDFSNQHTIKWEEPICVYMYDDEVKDKVAVTIRPGHCNLYMFPKVFWAKPAAPKGKGLGALISSAVAANKKPFEVLEGSYLKVLQLIFKTIAESPIERDILKLPDASGACSVLGLLVANNKAAIDVRSALPDRTPSRTGRPGPRPGMPSQAVAACAARCTVPHRAVALTLQRAISDFCAREALRDGGV